MPILAAIDIGANSVRLSIARYQGRRRRVIHEDREVTRLGESVFRTGMLAPAAMAHTVKVLRRFRRSIQHLGAEQVRVVATSPLRDARNARALIDWVRTATGWKIEVISGLEEGRLIHLGIASLARLRSARVLLVDLGGGSCEFTVSIDGHIRNMYSLSLGAVRLTSEFLQRDPPKKKELERLRGYIGEQLERIAPEIRSAKVQLTLATSGTAAALAALAGTPTVTRRMARQLALRLAGTAQAERAQFRGIGPRRAEIIVPGAALFAEMLPRLGVRSFRYSPLGLRDGLLAQMAAEQDAGRPGQIEAEREDALRAMAQHYGVDEPHAARVRELAAILFRRLRPLHRLPAEYAEWIGAAAMLHEVGNFINRSGGRRHSQYIIAHSEIFGYTPGQRRLIAALARYQGSSRPPFEQEDLRKAAVLLRLARALDQGRRGAVLSLRFRKRAEQLHLALRARPGQADLEVWALEKERGYFREVFGLELVVTGVS